MGGGDVTSYQKLRDVIYGRPLSGIVHLWRHTLIVDGVNVKIIENQYAFNDKAESFS